MSASPKEPDKSLPRREADPSPAGPAPARPWLILFTLCPGFFMILLDTTIVNVAIPDLSAELPASLDQILWVLNAYVLVYAGLLITSGRLGDLYGPKRLFISGLLVFTLASILCGLAQNPTQLIGARALQGAGGALLTPQTVAVLTIVFPPARRGAAFGVWGAVAGLATIAGPALGGLVVTTWGWRWIFLINLPVGVFAVIMASLVLPDLRVERRHRLDLTGTFLATSGLFLVIFGLIEGPSHGWGAIGPVSIPLVIGAGVLLLAGFGRHQYRRRDSEPLVPLAIFRNRNFAMMNLVTAALGVSTLGLFLPLMIYLQSALGWSALEAGLTIAPMSVVAMVLAPIAGRLADRVDGKYPLLAGLFLLTTGMVVLLLSSRVDSTQASLLPGIVLTGAGLGLTFAPMQAIAMRTIEPAMAGAAAGLINTTRQVGAMVGSAAVGALLQAQLARTVPAAGSFELGFTNAMRITLVLPTVVIGLAGLAVLAVQPGPRSPTTDQDQDDQGSTARSVSRTNTSGRGQEPTRWRAGRYSTASVTRSSSTSACQGTMTISPAPGDIDT